MPMSRVSETNRATSGKYCFDSENRIDFIVWDTTLQDKIKTINKITKIILTD